MPFYEYECPACKYYAEVLQKISDKPLKKCPSCGKTGFKRLVSAPVFRLKGSGWYETDFKSDKEGQRNLAGAEREEAKPVDAKSKGDDKAAGADSKPDSKAESKPEKKESTPSRGVKPAARTTSRRSAAHGARRPAKSTKRGKGRR